MMGQVAPALTICAARRNAAHSSRNASSRLRKMTNAATVWRTHPT